MNRRSFALLLFGGAAAALTGCSSQSYQECAEQYTKDYTEKHKIPPTPQQVESACSTRSRRRTTYYNNRTNYGSGSRGSTRGGSTGSGK